MGMGCGAAIPNLQCAAAVSRSEGMPVLSVAVEICSATLFLGPEPELVVSNSIFGDGASAAVVAGNCQKTDGGLVKIIDFESGIFPKFREELCYRTEQGKLRNFLTKRVPIIGAKTVGEVTNCLLDRHKISIKDIDFWAVHPGGTAVLEQVEEKLGITKQHLRFSYDIFKNYGNMSSPSVMFVLKTIIEKARPRPGQNALLLSFGAGFSSHAALVEFV